MLPAEIAAYVAAHPELAAAYKNYQNWSAAGSKHPSFREQAVAAAKAAGIHYYNPDFEAGLWTQKTRPWGENYYVDAAGNEMGSYLNPEWVKFVNNWQPPAGGGGGGGGGGTAVIPPTGMPGIDDPRYLSNPLPPPTGGPDQLPGLPVRGKLQMSASTLPGVPPPDVGLPSLGTAPTGTLTGVPAPTRKKNLGLDALNRLYGAGF